MPALRDIQLRCREAFLAGSTDALAGLLHADADALAVGIGVYQNNARETFRQALADSYPIVAALTGENCFAGLAAKYLEAYPSRTADLQDFGERFPDFLEQCYAESAHRYLPDVARLELATEQILLEREPAPLDPHALTNIPASAASELRFNQSPGSRLVSSEFPIVDIWRMHFHDDATNVSLEAGPSHVVVVRESGDSVLRPLSAQEFTIAEQLCRGASLGDVFERLNDAGDGSVFHTALARLLRYRLFSDFDIKQRRLT